MEMSTVAPSKMKMHSPVGGGMNTPATSVVVGMSALHSACDANGRGSPHGYRVANPPDDDEASSHKATPFASAGIPAGDRSTLTSLTGPTIVCTNWNGMSTYEEPVADTYPSRSTTSRGGMAVVVMQKLPELSTGT